MNSTKSKDVQAQSNFIMGDVLSKEQKFSEAIEYYEKAYEVFKKVLGDDHPNTKVVKDNLDLVKK